MSNAHDRSRHVLRGAVIGAVALVSGAITTQTVAQAPRVDDPARRTGRALQSRGFEERDEEGLLRQPHHAIAAAPWISAQEHDGVVYVMFSFPPLVQRYDMTTREWLSEIALDTTPTAFAIGSAGLFVAFHQEVRRYDVDGGSEQALTSLPYDVSYLLLTPSALLAGANDLLTSVSVFDGSTISANDYFRSMIGPSIADDGSRLFARSSGISPSDIVAVDIAPDGALGLQSNSPFHGDLPGAVRTFVLPGVGVSDNSGTVYTSDLDYLGSLAGAYDDLATFDQGYVLLRGDHLVLHDLDFLERARFALAEDVRSIFVSGSSAFGFYSSPDGAAVVEAPLASFAPPAPPPPVDPTGLAYEPERIVADEAGLIHLLDQETASIFRWSPASGDYLPTIPLIDPPLDVTVGGPDRAVYTGYTSGAVRRIEFSEGAPDPEQPFANVAGSATDLLAAPDFLVVHGSSLRGSHWVFAHDATLLSRRQVWSSSLSPFQWNEANRRLYHFRGGSPRDLMSVSIDEQGVIESIRESPLHSSTGMLPPIRVHPEGFIVILGSGRFHDAIDLTLLSELGTTLTDAAWAGDQLVTLHLSPSGSELRYWSRFLTRVLHRVPLEGDPLAAFEQQGDLLVVTSIAGVPSFTRVRTPLFTEDFEQGDLLRWIVRGSDG